MGLFDINQEGGAPEPSACTFHTDIRQGRGHHTRSPRSVALATRAQRNPQTRVMPGDIAEADPTHTEIMGSRLD